MTDNEMLRQLFVAMPDEQLSEGFNDRVMEKVRRKALLHAKLCKIRECACYSLGAAAMIAVCVFVLKYLEIEIPFPDMSLSAISFPKLSLTGLKTEIFHSPSWHISFFTMLIALFLLVIDSTIRRHIKK
ncbi:MAG: hypothetical protein LBR18_04770 [Tannerella sp.]|jgi:hypothetical protein|nr:hypothetical protein [Tannerella sp.]